MKFVTALEQPEKNIKTSRYLSLVVYIPLKRIISKVITTDVPYFDYVDIDMDLYVIFQGVNKYKLIGFDYPLEITDTEGLQPFLLVGEDICDQLVRPLSISNYFNSIEGYDGELFMYNVKNSSDYATFICDNKNNTEMGEFDYVVINRAKIHETQFLDSQLTPSKVQKGGSV